MLERPKLKLDPLLPSDLSLDSETPAYQIGEETKENISETIASSPRSQGEEMPRTLAQEETKVIPDEKSMDKAEITQTEETAEINDDDEFTLPLPDNVEKFEAFMLSPDGRVYLEGVAKIAERLKQWGKQNGADTIVTQVMKKDGNYEKVTEKVEDIIDLFYYKHFTAEGIKKQADGFNKINFPLYKEGIYILSRVITKLNSKDVPADKLISLERRKDIYKNLVSGLNVCAPGCYTNICKADQNLSTNISEILKAKKTEIIFDIIMNLMKNEKQGGNFYHGHETHNAVSIMNYYSDELGIGKNEDAHATKIENDSSGNLPLTVLAVEKFPKVIEADLKAENIIGNLYDEKIDEILEALENVTTENIKEKIEIINFSLKKFGKDKAFNALNLFNLDEDAMQMGKYKFADDRKVISPEEMKLFIIDTITHRLANEKYLNLAAMEARNISENCIVYISAHNSLQLAYVMDHGARVPYIIYTLGNPDKANALITCDADLVDIVLNAPIEKVKTFLQNQSHEFLQKFMTDENSIINVFSKVIEAPMSVQNKINLLNLLGFESALKKISAKVAVNILTQAPVEFRYKYFKDAFNKPGIDPEVAKIFAELPDKTFEPIFEKLGGNEFLKTKASYRVFFIDTLARLDPQRRQNVFNEYGLDFFKQHFDGNDITGILSFLPKDSLLENLGTLGGIAYLKDKVNVISSLVALFRSAGAEQALSMFNELGVEYFKEISRDKQNTNNNSIASVLRVVPSKFQPTILTRFGGVEFIENNITDARALEIIFKCYLDNKIDIEKDIIGNFHENYLNKVLLKVEDVVRLHTLFSKHYPVPERITKGIIQDLSYEFFKNIDARSLVILDKAMGEDHKLRIFTHSDQEFKNKILNDDDARRVIISSITKTPGSHQPFFKANGGVPFALSLFKTFYGFHDYFRFVDARRRSGIFRYLGIEGIKKITTNNSHCLTLFTLLPPDTRKDLLKAEKDFFSNNVTDASSVDFVKDMPEFVDAFKDFSKEKRKELLKNSKPDAAIWLLKYMSTTSSLMDILNLYGKSQFFIDKVIKPSDFNSLYQLIPKEEKADILIQLDKAYLSTVGSFGIKLFLDSITDPKEADAVFNKHGIELLKNYYDIPAIFSKISREAKVNIFNQFDASFLDVRVSGQVFESIKNSLGTDFSWADVCKIPQIEDYLRYIVGVYLAKEINFFSNLDQADKKILYGTLGADYFYQLINNKQYNYSDFKKDFPTDIVLDFITKSAFVTAQSDAFSVLQDLSIFSDQNEILTILEKIPGTYISDYCKQGDHNRNETETLNQLLNSIPPAARNDILFKIKGISCLEEIPVADRAKFLSSLKPAIVAEVADNYFNFKLLASSLPKSDVDKFINRLGGYDYLKTFLYMPHFRNRFIKDFPDQADEIKKLFCIVEVMSLHGYLDGLLETYQNPDAKHSKSNIEEIINLTKLISSETRDQSPLSIFQTVVGALENIYLKEQTAWCSGVAGMKRSPIEFIEWLAPHPPNSDAKFELVSILNQIYKNHSHLLAEGGNHKKLADLFSRVEMKNEPSGEMQEAKRHSSGAS